MPGSSPYPAHNRAVGKVCAVRRQLCVTLSFATGVSDHPANLRGRLSDAAPRCAPRATARWPRDAEAHANPEKKPHTLFYFNFDFLSNLFWFTVFCAMLNHIWQCEHSWFVYLPYDSTSSQRMSPDRFLAVSHEYLLLCRCFLSEEPLVFLRNETRPQLGLAGPCTYSKAYRPDPHLGHVTCAAGATFRRPLPPNLEPT